jgi:DHA1 family bicyclomycin/chloramphenicol resistance-like MFS transporter
LIGGVWIGSVIASRLIGRLPIGCLMVQANLISVAAAALCLAALLLGMANVPLIVGTMFVFTVGVGVAAPAALTQAVSVNPLVIGSASGLYGFAQMAIGAVCTALAGIGDNPALAATLILTVAGIIAQAAFWLAQRR